MSIKIFEKIEKEIVHLLKVWQVDNNRINIKRELKGSLKIIFDARKNGVQFRLTVYAVLIEEVFVDNRYVQPNKYLNWKMNCIFIVQNQMQISLSVAPETLSDKVFKFFGGKEKEVFNKEFDSLYFVTSDHDYAYAKILDEDLQNLFMKNPDGFKKIWLHKNELRYEEPFHFKESNWKTKKERFLNLLDLMMKMSENINKLKQEE